MRKIEGFVCIAEIADPSHPRQRRLFGRPQDPSLIERGYEAFATNGLVPFISFIEAWIARDEMRKNRYFRSVSIATIEMKMIEDDRDLELPAFRSHGRWVVTREGDLGTEIIGPCRSKHRTTLPGASIELNCLQPFRDFARVRYVASEHHRQSFGAKTRIATFDLRIALV